MCKSGILYNNRRLVVLLVVDCSSVLSLSKLVVIVPLALVVRACWPLVYRSRCARTAVGHSCTRTLVEGACFPCRGNVGTCCAWRSTLLSTYPHALGCGKCHWSKHNHQPITSSTRSVSDRLNVPPKRKARMTTTVGDGSRVAPTPHYM